MRFTWLLHPRRNVSLFAMRRMIAGLHDQLVIFDIADEELGCLADDIVLVIGGAALFGVATTASWRGLACEYIG